MKNINKNSTWLSLTLITLLLYIIAMYAIGFKYAGGDAIITLETISKAAKASGALGYVGSANGLFVSALVFTSIAICLVISKWVLDELNIKTKLANKYWDFVFLGVIILAAILIIAGTSLFINKMVGDPNLNPGGSATAVDSGRSAGIFILVILTIPMNIIPIFMSNGEDSKPTVETAQVISSEVTSTDGDNSTPTSTN